MHAIITPQRLAKVPHDIKRRPDFSYSIVWTLCRCWVPVREVGTPPSPVKSLGYGGPGTKAETARGKIRKGGLQQPPPPPSLERGLTILSVLFNVFEGGIRDKNKTENSSFTAYQNFKRLDWKLPPPLPQSHWI